MVRILLELFYRQKNPNCTVSHSILFNIEMNLAGEKLNVVKRFTEIGLVL